MGDRYHAIHHPYASFEYLEGLKIGQELLTERGSAADDLIKVLLHPRAVPKEIDDAIGKYITRMSDSTDRYRRFLQRYDLIVGVPAAPILTDRWIDLSAKLKKVKGSTRKQIQRAIDEVRGLFIPSPDSSVDVD